MDINIKKNVLKIVQTIDFIFIKKIDFETSILGELSDIVGYVDNVSVEEEKLIGNCTFIDKTYEHFAITPNILIQEKDNNEIKKCELLGFSIMNKFSF